MYMKTHLVARFFCILQDIPVLFQIPFGSNGIKVSVYKHNYLIVICLYYFRRIDMSLAELQNKQTMVYESEQVSEYNF